MTNTPLRTGYAPVNGLALYYEQHGAGEPLILLHGGLGFGTMFGDLIPQLAAGRRVIVVDLQGHGRTADIDRPLRYELLADDVAALIHHLDLPAVDILGYSLGGGVALRAAIQHPALVRKLVLVSVACQRADWYPEVLASMEQLGGAAAPFMRDSPIYQSYVAMAPEPDRFPGLLDKLGDLLREEYDWSQEVARLPQPTLLMYGDADSIPPRQAAGFFELLGGGQGDAGWDGARMPRSRLAILPGTTHYNIYAAPVLADHVSAFLETSTSPAT